MELKEIFQTIRRRASILLIIVLLVTGSAYYYFSNQGVSYETSSIITVEATKENTAQYQYSGFYSIQSSDLFINTILGWVKNSNIVAEIYNRSEIDFDIKKIKSLGKKIYSKKVPPQNIVLIVTDENEENSIKIAQSTIDIVREKTNDMALIVNSSANFEIINSKPITVPKEANTPFNTMVAFIASLILALIAIFIIEYFSPKTNSSQKIKNIFGKDPISLKNIKIKGLVNIQSKESEKFRFLRSNIYSGKEKFCAIISGINEKNTTPLIAANIALSFARSGKKTVLVDGNFNTPNIHEYFDKKNESGFSEFLFDEKNINKYLQQTGESNLSIISGGIKLSYASDAMERAKADIIIDSLKERFDIALIVVPDLANSSESFSLFNYIKNVILVTKLGKTTISSSEYLNKFLEDKGIEKNIIVT